MTARSKPKSSWIPGIGNHPSIAKMVCRNSLVLLLKAEVFASFPNTVHSKADRVASPDAGEKIFYAAHEPRHLWMKEKSTHTAIYLDNPRRYKKG